MCVYSLPNTRNKGFMPKVKSVISTILQYSILDMSFYKMVSLYTKSKSLQSKSGQHQLVLKRYNSSLVLRNFILHFSILAQPLMAFTQNDHPFHQIKTACVQDLEKKPLCRLQCFFILTQQDHPLFKLTPLIFLLAQSCPNQRPMELLHLVAIDS